MVKGFEIWILRKEEGGKIRGGVGVYGEDSCFKYLKNVSWVYFYCVKRKIRV